MSESNSSPPQEEAMQGLPPLPENWSKMKGEDKCNYFVSGWSETEDKPFLSQTAKEKYARRAKRWLDVISLGQPDRVPTLMLADGFLLENAGCNASDAFYSPQKSAAAVYKAHTDFDCDYSMVLPVQSGRAYDMLEFKLIRWPGSRLPEGLPENISFQYIEAEHMRADEYDELIGNPEGFIFRKFLPRVCGKLNGLGMVGSLFNTLEASNFTSFLLPFAKGTPLRKSIEVLLNAADEAMAHFGPAVMEAGFKIMAEFGAPSLFGGGTFVPFDLLGDTLRGTTPLMLDMYRCPDNVTAACEALLPISIQMAVESAAVSRNPFIIIPLHKGADGFMSNEQFERFYWPYFKAQLLGMIDAGLVPISFVEGSYNQRLDIISNGGLPSGKTVWWFDRTDMNAAKEKIGGFACIGGNVPASLFFADSPGAMEKYCKDLIEIAAPGGGFFLAPGAVIDQAKPENIRAFIEATKEYGVY